MRNWMDTVSVEIYLENPYEHVFERFDSVSHVVSYNAVFKF